MASPLLISANTETECLVIGGGLGGLACAALAAKQGWQVSLFEKNPALGGKLGTYEKAGFSWDTGPSLITMPEVLEEIWTVFGACFPYELVRLPSTCRYQWEDGTVIHEDVEFWQRPECTKFLKHAAGLWEVSEGPFLRHDIRDLAGWKSLPGFGSLRHLPKLMSLQSLSDFLKRFFPEQHLHQLFCRFATYNGSSPYRTPAAFAIIPYVQAAFGGWYVRGGLYQIVEGLKELALSVGVQIHTGTEVTKVAPSGEGFEVVLADGTRRYAAKVVCNMDVLSAYHSIFPEVERERFFTRKVRHTDVSLSGMVLLLGLRGTTEGLEHHNIFFSRDYRSEFEALSAGELAERPTIYVAIDSKTEPERAPEGHENWFVLVNAPDCRTGQVDWDSVKESYADTVLSQLENDFGLKGLRDRVVVRELISPADFEQRHRSWGGSLYGFASHGLDSAFTRPPLASKSMPGLYFVGGTTHPGGGIPLVLRSAMMVARRLGDI
ncbi:MAG: phytoene desaturase family protein [Verrucomicrobiales bacterium]